MKSTKKKTKLTEYKTLEEIKADFLEQSHLEGLELSQSDVMDAIEHLDMSDSDLDELFDWFAENGIDVKSDEADDVNLLDDDALASEDDDLDFIDDDDDGMIR